jgi:hypothetical protein
MGISKETKEILADFLNEIRDYIHESGNNLVHDERCSTEFVDIYCKDWEGEKADYTSKEKALHKHVVSNSVCPKCKSEDTELIKLYNIWFCKTCCNHW